MKDSTVKAYAKAFCVLRRALYRAGAPVTASELVACTEKPADGMTPLFLRAAKSHALNEVDDDLLGVFLDEVDEDDIHTPQPIPEEQQGIWQVEYYHWRKIYTPEQAAEKLGVTKQRISALIKNGQLDYVKVRGRYYIPGYSVSRRMGDETAEEPE